MKMKIMQFFFKTFIPRFTHYFILANKFIRKLDFHSQEKCLIFVESIYKAQNIQLHRAEEFCGLKVNI